MAGSGILHRDWRRSMLQQGSGGTLAYGIGTGAAAGIVVGVFLGACRWSARPRGRSSAGWSGAG